MIHEQFIELIGNCENYVKIFDGQQVRFTCKHPLLFVYCTALGAMPIATAIVRLPDFPTTVTPYVRGPPMYGVRHFCTASRHLRVWDGSFVFAFKTGRKRSITFASVSVLFPIELIKTSKPVNRIYFCNVQVYQRGFYP